jgi:peptide chain release factor 2
LDRDATEARELLELLATEPDAQMSGEIAADLDQLEARLGRKELDVLFRDPYSKNPALVSISAGAGGVDAQDWAEMLLQMYQRWASSHSF